MLDMYIYDKDYDWNGVMEALLVSELQVTRGALSRLVRLKPSIQARHQPLVDILSQDPK